MDEIQYPLVVLLDTSIIREQGFNFDSALLRSLRDRIKEESVQLVRHDIIDRELVAQAVALTKPMFLARRQAVNDCCLLDPVLPQVDLPNIASTVRDSVLAGLEGLTDTVLSSHSDRATHVFDRYFARRPPFDTEDKRAEFPDAFVLDALEQYSKKIGKVVYAVAKDDDWRRFCDGNNWVRYFHELGDVLNLAVQRKSDLFDPLNAALAQLHADVDDVVYEVFKKDLPKESQDRCDITDWQRISNSTYDDPLIVDINEVYTVVIGSCMFTAEISWNDSTFGYYGAKGDFRDEGIGGMNTIRFPVYYELTLRTEKLKAGEVDVIQTEITDYYIDITGHGKELEPSSSKFTFRRAKYKPDLVFVEHLVHHITAPPQKPKKNKGKRG